MEEAPSRQCFLQPAGENQRVNCFTPWAYKRLLQGGLRPLQSRRCHLLGRPTASRHAGGGRHLRAPRLGSHLQWPYQIRPDHQERRQHFLEPLVTLHLCLRRGDPAKTAEVCYRFHLKPASRSVAAYERSVAGCTVIPRRPPAPRAGWPRITRIVVLTTSWSGTETPSSPDRANPRCWSLATRIYASSTSAP